jgi:hypothetical protein
MLSDIGFMFLLGEFAGLLFTFGAIAFIYKKIQGKLKTRKN